MKFLELVIKSVSDDDAIIGEHVTAEVADEYFAQACQSCGMPVARAGTIHELRPIQWRKMLNKIGT
jgi:hypothetical protein